jgi:hypothetical protein
MEMSGWLYDPAAFTYRKESPKRRVSMPQTRR